MCRVTVCCWPTRLGAIAKCEWTNSSAYGKATLPSPLNVTFHPMSAHSRDFVASSNLYQRRDIEAEALRPDEPETKVASASQPALNAVIAGTGNVSQHM